MASGHDDYKKGRWCIVEAYMEVGNSATEKIYDFNTRTETLRLLRKQSNGNHIMRVHIRMPTYDDPDNNAMVDFVPYRDIYVPRTVHDPLDDVDMAVNPDEDEGEVWNTSRSQGARMDYEIDSIDPSVIVIHLGFKNVTHQIARQEERKHALPDYILFDRIIMYSQKGAYMNVSLKLKSMPGLQRFLEEFQAGRRYNEHTKPPRGYYASRQEFRDFWTAIAKLNYDLMVAAWASLNLKGLTGQSFKLKPNVYRIVLGPGPQELTEAQRKLFRSQKGEDFRLVWYRGCSVPHSGKLRGTVSARDERVMHRRDNAFLAFSLYVPNQLVRSFRSAQHFDVEPVADKSGLKKQKTAAKQPQNLLDSDTPVANIVNTILFGEASECVERSAELQERHMQSLMDAGLNDTQCHAAFSALGRRLTLIQGPPGTGKSRTAIQTCAAHWRGADFKSPGSVLIVAQSNIVVNALLNEWLKISQDPQLAPIRIVRYTNDDGLRYHRQFKRKNQKDSKASVEDIYKLNFGDDDIDQMDCQEDDDGLGHQVGVAESMGIDPAGEDKRGWVDLYQDKYRIENVGAFAWDAKESTIQELDDWTDNDDDDDDGASQEDPDTDEWEDFDDDGEYDDGEDEKLGYPYEHSLAAKLFEVDPTWEEQLEDYTVGKMTRQEQRIFHAHRDKLRAQVLKNADIVFATLSGAGGRPVRAASPKLVIIDEAGQASEIESMIPITLPSIEQVVMFGDHLQLPPVNVFDVVSLKQSLLERLAIAIEKTPDRPACEIHMLDYNYRSVPEIVHFFSDHWYQGQLKPTVDLPTVPCIERLACRGKLQQNSRILWLDTDWPDRIEEYSQKKIKKIKETTLKSGTKKNHSNVFGVFWIISYMIREDPDLRKNIAVIAMYNGEVSLIRACFAANGYGDIRVGTVDSFQGSESDIVVLDLVRWNDGRNIGFLREQKRLNVAVSRARKHMIVVGSYAFYSKSPEFQYRKCQPLKDLADASSQIIFPMGMSWPESVDDFELWSTSHGWSTRTLLRPTLRLTKSTCF